jgi:hypothetical protein
MEFAVVSSVCPAGVFVRRVHAMNITQALPREAESDGMALR